MKDLSEMKAVRSPSALHEEIRKVDYQKYGLLFALVLLCCLFSILSPVFLTQQNILNVLNQTSINAILAIGVTFVILIGGIDLGLGSYVALTGCVAALFAQGGNYPVFIPILAGIGAGLLIGLINGVVITRGRLASFIVTLGMMTIARGISLVVSGGRPISNLSDSFNYIGGGVLFHIPLPILIVIVIFIATYILLSKTTHGRYIYAVGGNDEAARTSGIHINRVKLAAFTLCGGLAGLAGVIQASRITTGQPNIGVGYELDAIAAVVIGGTSLTGGIGRVSGTIIGVMIIGVINNGLDLMNVSSYYQQIIKGLIIICALLLDRKSKQ
ncbi:ribose ABC transporter permease [Paenibacillus frigoriresistens]|uniref:ABC transporter permease n=1 Tax=Paenibacillus alginolyticus TaxID=59839 RepID=UPI00156453D2|nr:ribose ABC transporter permease [Paenibacillus frigoriresistens]NRF96163.1 ribose ABC transporter permease [Paenibacillus frigoriresistens]